ncbi:MAG: N-acetyl-alpha-D-glucosaminyl L-malate synthase BshA [Lentisphaeria bacterium]|nr:N-acetyl-alpha-D-glucosaminyl L-malate synthase BshA [Lentisphaeria bacterium]NQZ68496.1 N-acetyl-alpha-D-glucosaminyl L-malate synthase BshA [Lentisphaeria bacterium]
MNIAIVCYPTIGGSGLIATELGIGLAELGHNVHFISYSTPFKLSSYRENISFHSVDPINYPLFNQSLYTFALTAKIIEVVNDYEIDVVHAHYSIPHSLCAHLAREISDKCFKIVTTLHGTDVTIVGQDKPLYPINKYGIEKSDHVTTVSQFQKDYTLQEFNIDKTVHVIYNFIDTEVFKPSETHCRRSSLAADDEKIVMHVSNFRDVKNPIGALKSFAEASKQVKARLVLVGDGPELLKIKIHCRELDICDKVKYMGKVDNVESILPLADCVLQPSHRESFGMVLLESMACEVPTISSNVDGIPEVIVHGETGYMEEPDDHEAMAAHIVTVLTDPELNARLGQNGRQRAIDVFHKDIIIPQYLRCYQSACDSQL